MSDRLAFLFLVAVVAAEVALRVAQAIDKAVTWACPCSGGER